MIPDNPERLSERLTNLIASLDAGMAAGQAPVAEDDPDLPPEELQLYRLARASLQRLERAWPRPPAPVSGEVPAIPPPTLDPLTGQGQIGKFRIQRELGRGGSGIVFLATDTETSRDVALKLPRLEALLDADLRHRFLEEAQVTLKLDHPGLVPVLEAGEFGAICYIASAYVGEATLASWLNVQIQDVPVRTAAALVAALARAVDYLNEHRILHRDIKPSNVLLDTNPRTPKVDRDLALTGIPRLTDFGLAKLMDTAKPAAQQTGMTGGLVLGTAEYMAPEQAERPSDTLGKPCDVYALGAVLYEMLVGQPPLVGRNRFDTLRKVVTEAPQRLRRLRRDVPRDLEAVCLKCLEKDPHLRYASAGLLADDLERFLSGVPTLARPVSWWQHAWRWSRRRPAAATLLLLASLAPFVLTAAVCIIDRTIKHARAEELQHGLLNAAAANLAPVIPRVREHLPHLATRLQRVASNPEENHEQRLRAALVLAPTDAAAAAYLQERALTVGPMEIRLICEALAQWRYDYLSGWKSTLLDAQVDRSQRLRTACLLAQLATEAEFWSQAGATVAELVVAEPLVDILGWAQLLEPVKSAFLPHLVDKYWKNARTPAANSVVAALLAEYHTTDPHDLIAFLSDADLEQFSFFFARLKVDPPTASALLKKALADPISNQAQRDNKERFARKQANLCLALMRLGHMEEALDELKLKADPRIRSHLVHGMKAAQIDPLLLVQSLRSRTLSNGARSALLLALGDYSPDRISAGQRAETNQELVQLYHTHPDSGVHSAAEWLLNHWEMKPPRPQQSLEQALNHGRHWYTTREGHTLALVIPPAGAKIAPPGTQTGDRRAQAAQHDRDQSPVGILPFAIATHETTAEQFQRMAREWTATKKITAEHLKKYAPRYVDPNSLPPQGSRPANDLTFIGAALYCNWLSEVEGIPPSEWYYEVTPEDLGRNTLLVETVSPDRQGYRLPSEAEWEYACRAGTETARFLGEGTAYVSEYAWNIKNTEAQAGPVGRLRPNPLGLFDVYGNVFEWCMHSWDGIPSQNEVLKGGSWRHQVTTLHSTLRGYQLRAAYNDTVGFRVARTVRATPLANLQSKADNLRTSQSRDWFLNPVKR